MATNPQLEELACSYVLDRLDARERAAFEARLLHDPQLATLVHELEESLAARVKALPRREPSPGLLDRIESRIERLPASASRPDEAVVIPFWKSAARWGIAAVIAVSLGVIATQQLLHWKQDAQPIVMIVGLDPQRSTMSELRLTGGAETPDARFIQLASLAEKYWEKPEALPIKWSSGEQNGRGYALFDPASNQGFIAVQQLPAPGEGKRYHLWVHDSQSGKVTEAGSLPSDHASRGLYFFSLTPATGMKPENLGFFVTVEDNTTSTSPEKPRGRVVLGEKHI